MRVFAVLQVLFNVIVVVHLWANRETHLQHIKFSDQLAKHLATIARYLADQKEHA